MQLSYSTAYVLPWIFAGYYCEIIHIYIVHMWPWTIKPVISSMVIFVAIANNILYGSKLFILCQKSLGYWMNEWIMHLYSALLCIVVHPKCFTIMWGVSPQPPPVCSIHLDDATAATGLPLVRSPHTSYRWRGESHGANQVDGIIKRPRLTRASGGNLARTPGLHPYSLREVPWDL